MFTMTERDILLCIEALAFYSLYSEEMGSETRTDARNLAIDFSGVVSLDTLNEAKATVDAMETAVNKVVKRVTKKRPKKK